MARVMKITSLVLLFAACSGAARGAGVTLESVRDVDTAVSWLAGKEGGASLDLRKGFAEAGPPFMIDEVGLRGADGRRLWALILPDEADLEAALRTAGGRLAPGEGDIVLVASRAGVLARVPALSAHPSAIDEAFESSRRMIAADLESGLVTFVKKLDEAEASRRGQVRMLLLAVAVIFSGILLLGLRSWGLFRREKGQWDRENQSRHRDLVQACQERLHRLSTPGATADAAAYDACYRELQELSVQDPAESTAGLTILCEKMDHLLDGSKGVR